MLIISSFDEFDEHVFNSEGVIFSYAVSSPRHNDDGKPKTNKK